MINHLVAGQLLDETLFGFTGVARGGGDKYTGGFVNRRQSVHKDKRKS